MAAAGSTAWLQSNCNPCTNGWPRTSARSTSDWIGSRFGATLTVGAVCSIAALAVGVRVTRPNVRRLLALGQRATASDGPPAPEIVAEIGAVQQRLKVAARVSLALLIVAVTAMAAARYL